MLTRVRVLQGLFALLALMLAAPGAFAEGHAADSSPERSPALEEDFRVEAHGRLQVDQYNYFARGASEAGLHATFLVKRFNLELSGELAGSWQVLLQADMAPSGLDPTQSPALKPAAAICTITYRFAPELNVELGQGLAPFTPENLLPSRAKVFLENGLVQQLSLPSSLEIGAMLWGDVGEQLVGYRIGVFNGDGSNRWSPDNRVDLIGRVWSKPFGAALPLLRGAQIGGSFRVGSRDPERVIYDYPGMATQGGFKFWRTTYEGLEDVVHVLPAGRQLALAAEAQLPLDRFDMTGELVHVSNGTREAPAEPRSSAIERTGTLSGIAAQGQIGVWVMGSRDILRPTGLLRTASRSADRPNTLPESALEVAVRAEVLRARYESGVGKGAPDERNIDGDIRVNALLLGVKYWWNPTVRWSTTYCIYDFPGSGPVEAAPNGTTPAQTAHQRAMAPGNTLQPGASEAARASHALHELLLRLEVSF